MRMCTGFKEFRATCPGLIRPKPTSHQPSYGWTLGYPEQRHDVPVVYALHPKHDSDAFCISASTNSSKASMLWEEDVFEFEFENELPTSKQPETNFRMDKLVSAGIEKSRTEVSMGKKPGMLQVALKQSAPLEVQHPTKQGDVAKNDLHRDANDLESQIDVHALETQSQPIAIPGHMTLRPNSNRNSASSMESFVPPHIFAARMNNDLIPNSYRPRGLASLRQRTAVLSETGYLDGYTEMGQRPKKPIARHCRNAFSA